MPVAPKPAPYVAFSWQYEVSFHNCVNTFYYTGGVPDGSMTNAILLAQAFKIATSANFLACLAADVRVYGLLCELVQGDDTFSHFEGPEAFGVLPGDSLPAQDVTPIIWHVARVAGQRLPRGKSYMSGNPEGVQAFGRISNAQANAWDVFAESVLNFVFDSDIGGLDLAIWSPKAGVFKVCTAATVQGELRTQRKRRPES